VFQLSPQSISGAAFISAGRNGTKLLLTYFEIDVWGLFGQKQIVFTFGVLAFDQDQCEAAKITSKMAVVVHGSHEKVRQQKGAEKRRREEKVAQRTIELEPKPRNGVALGFPARNHVARDIPKNQAGSE
jgi:hypothetical protein